MLSPTELDATATVFIGLAWVFFVAGGFICVLNFKLFLDWVVYRMKKLPEESYKYISPIPILGSLFVALTLGTLASIQATKIIGAVLIAMDMGGIHWMVLGICYQMLRSAYRRIRK
ncbi:hypothetical protein [Candidatus Methylobacter oryzae]|uniref:Amino acid permease/ SLC12A domain-containing protein n=1 Tax=Candidatus Methylobacter oryzae TaxID=2497749 RepID=A0ABY3CBX1_9GAMM|nr:hypothetical protein [Candidatus Methylobacter oryzae]TRW95396.1 hypothetical protein EKO24_010075 [Candidatus Methylobacter oryzae]